MLHIPAHKNVSDPPGQWINKDKEKTVYEVRELLPTPYVKDKPPALPKPVK